MNFQKVITPLEDISPKNLSEKKWLRFIEN